MSHISHKITLPQCGVGAGTDAYACPIRKSQLEAIKACLEKLLPKICKPQTKARACLDVWEADFETLRTKGYFQPGLTWKPIPNVVHGNTRDTGNQTSTTHEQIMAVPDVLHAGWTKKDRERAEVVCMCVAEVC